MQQQISSGQTEQTIYNPHQLTISSVLGRSFTTFSQNIPVFFGLGLAAMLPSLVIDLFFPDAGFKSTIIDRILTVLIQGAICYAVYQSLTGGRATLGDSLSKGMNRLGVLIIAALLTNLLIIVGLLLLVVPGIIVSCVLAVTIPVCVIEGSEVIASMKRSAELTKGYRLTIFILYTLATVAMFLLMLIPSFLVELLTGSEAAGLVSISLIGAFPVAYMAIMTAMIYYDLRVIKEGISLDSLAAVFD